MAHEEGWGALLEQAALPALWLAADGQLTRLNAAARRLGVTPTLVGAWVEAARRAGRMQTQVVCAGGEDGRRVFECCVWPAGVGAAAAGWLCLLSPCDAGAAGERAAGEELLPICARCRRVREGAAWVPVETYACVKLGRRLTHGLCPSCAAVDLDRL